MTEILPLHGITYNQQSEMKNLIAPPYDVIDDNEQEKLYQKSPHNIVRLILGKLKETDSETDNQYTRAAESFSNWQYENVLTKAEKPCIYYYVQEYTDKLGKLVTRKGFIARNKIETFAEGNIMPHEYTMGGPKEDRLKLMKACEANFSQIFMLYSDKEKKIDHIIEKVCPKEPFIDVTSDDGLRDIVYAIDDPVAIAKIKLVMRDKKLLIADGHHRYETAIAYRDYRRQQDPAFSEFDEFNYVMCYYTNTDDENLKVYPTHRIVEREVDVDKLIKDIEVYFESKEYNFYESSKEEIKKEVIEELESEERISFALYDGTKFYIFKLRYKEAMDAHLAKQGVAEVLRDFDLSVLHEYVITGLLKFSKEDQFAQNGIKYIKKEDEAFDSVDNGAGKIAFIMASPKIDLINKISAAGLRMPQKSTFFYPKLTSGLVINSLK